MTSASMTRTPKESQVRGSILPRAVVVIVISSKSSTRDQVRPFHSGRRYVCQLTSAESTNHAINSPDAWSYQSTHRRPANRQKSTTDGRPHYYFFCASRNVSPAPPASSSANASRREAINLYAPGTEHTARSTNQRREGPTDADSHGLQERPES